MCDTLANLVGRKEWVSCLVLICFTLHCIRSSAQPARPLPVASGKAPRRNNLQGKLVKCCHVLRKKICLK